METEESRVKRPTYPVLVLDHSDERPAEVVRFGGALFARAVGGPWRLVVCTRRLPVSARPTINSAAQMYRSTKVGTFEDGAAVG